MTRIHKFREHRIMKNYLLSAVIGDIAGWSA